nr:sugar nucleotide-binding protein [Hymenobacter sp. 5516J-16]
MKILITGSNGLLGQKLVELLKQQSGVEVVATSRGANKLAAVHPQVRFVPLDVTVREQVLAVIGREKPTHLVHTAAMTNVDECELHQQACWEQNVTAVAHLIEACELHQVHLVHVSTDFVFSGDEGPWRRKRRQHPSIFTEKVSWPPSGSCRPVERPGPFCARPSCMG